MTCKASKISKATRSDRIFVNNLLFPAVRGFQVDTCDEYPAHQPLQLRLEAGALSSNVDKHRKTTSASKLFEQRILEEHGKHSDQSVEQTRKQVLGQLHSAIDHEVAKRHDTLTQAAAKGDTTAIWRIISSAAEVAFSDFFQLQGKARSAMSGRGTFRKINHKLTALGAGRENAASSEAKNLNNKSEAYATQARRLGHTADRAKQLAAISITELRKEELNSQNLMTLRAFAYHFVDRADPEEIEIQERISQLDNQGAAISCTYTRTHKWYIGKAALLKNQAMQAHTKAITETCRVTQLALKLCQVH